MQVTASASECSAQPTAASSPGDVTRVSVVVVGGGPAGLSAAMALGLEGQTVLVLEGGRWPRDKVCGEGVMPVGVEILQRLGVLQLIEDDQMRPFEGVSWINLDGTRATADFALGAGLGIRRTGLSAALVRRVESLPTVCLWDRARVTGLEQRDDGALLTVERHGEVVRVLADLVIGADGRHSKLRQLVHLQGPPAVRMRRWGARQHFQVRPWSSHVEVWWGPGIEAYVTPSSDGRVELAFLWSQDRFRPPLKGPRLVEGLLQFFPELRARLGDPLPASDSASAALGPLAVAARRGWADRTILVGDALGYVDGITGEGITAALVQAEILSRLLPPLLRDGALSHRHLAAVGRQVTGVYRATVPLVRAALLLHRFPRLRRLVMAVLSRSPRLFTHLLEVNQGRRKLLGWSQASAAKGNRDVVFSGADGDRQTSAAAVAAALRRPLQTGQAADATSSRLDRG